MNTFSNELITGVMSIISKLRIKNVDNLPVYWWKKVNSFKTRKEFDFTDGLNIVIGPNASGKSTLLTLLAKIFHCEQGRISKLTRHSIDELFGTFDEKKDLGVELVTDGQPVGYFNPDLKIGGMGYIDYDFLGEHLNSMFVKGSQGQKTMRDFIKTCRVLKDTDEISWGMDGSCNDLWQNRIDIIKKTIKKSVPLGKKTLLFDEPERSLDLQNELVLFSKTLPIVVKEFQVIIATHSPFAFFMDANFIELKRGYRNRMKKDIESVIIKK